MIRSFHDGGTKDVYDGLDTKAARKACPPELWESARRRLDRLSAATGLGDLAAVRGNRLEKLHRDREGQYSIRVNDQYRICFVWQPEGAEEVEIVDYH